MQNSKHDKTDTIQGWKKTLSGTYHIGEVLSLGVGVIKGSLNSRERRLGGRDLSRLTWTKVTYPFWKKSNCPPPLLTHDFYMYITIYAKLLPLILPKMWFLTTLKKVIFWKLDKNNSPTTWMIHFKCPSGDEGKKKCTIPHPAPLPSKN